MKYSKLLLLIAAFTLILTACNTSDKDNTQNITSDNSTTVIDLADGAVEVSGKEKNAVYTANDIVYYESGKDFTYGEGTESDAHSSDEAAAHTVVHINAPGTYEIRGKLPLGQIAVDLGEDAKEDPEAVVTLILNGVDITCEVAPAIIFYNVYECGSDDADSASKDVDTSSAGANVIIADGSENTVNGSYVAKIYKPDSVTMSDDGTEIEDAKKLHKYDGAFYSKMSMNISGKGNLTINAENEGLGTELHLTVNDGNITINSGNDGINTNEDNVSVTTVNGGRIEINVTGKTGEGDGIDSNGWLVINSGTVITSACGTSMDSGIDSDMGIHINGGTVISSGNMLDRLEDGGQTYAVFTFAKKQSAGDNLILKNESDEVILDTTPDNDYTILLYSAPNLVEGTYTLWNNGIKLSAYSNTVGRPGMPEEFPDNVATPPPFGEIPEGEWKPNSNHNPGENQPTGDIPPHDGMTPHDGMSPPKDKFPTDETDNNAKTPSPLFEIVSGANIFGGITAAE